MRAKQTDDDALTVCGLVKSYGAYGSQADNDGMAGETGNDRPAWSPEDFAAMGAFMQSFAAELAESGELVETRGLAAPAHTRRVRQHNGAPVVSDGPRTEDLLRRVAPEVLDAVVRRRACSVPASSPARCSSCCGHRRPSPATASTPTGTR